MAFPILVMMIFGILTYRNMRLLKRTAELSNADRQLVIMVGLQIILALLATIPYGSYQVYALATASIVKSAEQSGRDLLFVSVTTMISISHFGVSTILSLSFIINDVYHLLLGKLLYFFSRIESFPSKISR